MQYILVTVLYLIWDSMFPWISPLYVLDYFSEASGVLKYFVRVLILHHKVSI